MVLKGANKLHDLIQKVLKLYTITSRGAKLQVGVLNCIKTVFIRH